MDSKKIFLYVSKKSRDSDGTFGFHFLIWWISITLIYTVLYSNYLDKTHIESVGGHIAGFFGLFTPVGLLSLVTGLLFPNYLLGNFIAIVLIGITIFIGSKIKISGIKEVILILMLLFTITYISDEFRTIIGSFGTGFTSWEIFINGKIPEFH